MLDLLLGTARSLRVHALRFTLTSLGIVWGAFMLTFLSASMGGVNRHFVTELEEAGPKIIFSGPGSILKTRIGERGARPVEFKADDVDRIGRLHAVENASPNLHLWSQIVRAGRRTKLLHVQGVDAAAESIRNFEVREGRFLTRTDVERSSRTAFLGARAAKRLFGRAPATGNTIHINALAFRVVGVSVAKGDQLVNSGNPDDLAVLIPYTTAQRWFLQSDRITEMVFAPVTRQASWHAIRRARELLGLHHDFHPDLDTAVWFFNLHEVLTIVYRLLLALRVFMVSAGVITLLVGAVSVMNIMLVVVGERTNEIGLRKAVGASSRAIFLQFLAEAVAVCGLSGVLGTGLGVLFTRLMAAHAPAEGPMSSPPVLDALTVSAIAVSLTVVGIVAGVTPAARAAKVPPAEALRAV